MAPSKTDSSLAFDSKYRLNSGQEMPVIGFGSHEIPAPIAEVILLEAFRAGYRLVDSAIAYRNEKGVAQAIKHSEVPRSEFFFTTKIPPKSMGYEKAKRAIDTSLRETQEEYFDLILVESPFGGRENRLGTWRALVEAQNEGKTRSIGVANFGVHHLNELEEYINSGGGGTIDVAQYELHPWLARPEISEWLRQRNVVIESVLPMANETRINDPLAQTIAEKHHKSTRQILVRWCLQKGYVPLPKAMATSRIREDRDVFDFHLDDEDMELLDTRQYQPSTWDPTVDRS